MNGASQFANNNLVGTSLQDALTTGKTIRSEDHITHDYSCGGSKISTSFGGLNINTESGKP